MGEGSADKENPTILVVDDDGDIRAALEMMLQYEGFGVWTARRREEALARLEQGSRAGRHPGVILTDVKMPGLDGLSPCSRSCGSARSTRR